jgi:hypothetical protein
MAFYAAILGGSLLFFAAKKLRTPVSRASLNALEWLGKDPSAALLAFVIL